MFCPFLCDRDEQLVRDMARENHGFFLYGLGHYAFFGEHEPARTNIWDNYKNQPAKVKIDDPLAAASPTQTCLGTPAQIPEALNSFPESPPAPAFFPSPTCKI